MKLRTWLLLAILGNVCFTAKLLPQIPAPTSSAPSAADPSQTSSRFDVLVLKNGSRVEGVLVSETPTGIRFKVVLKRASGPCQVLETEFAPEEIAHLQRLSPSQRQETVAMLARWTSAANRRSEKEKAIQLTPTTGPDGKPAGHRTSTTWFAISSDINEEYLRQLTVRLDELLTAAAALFAVAVPEQPAMHMAIFRRWEDYAAWQRRRRLRVLNPALYDPQRKELAAACDVDELFQQLERERQRTKATLAQLDDFDLKLRRHFAGAPPIEVVGRLREQRWQMLAALTENEALLERQKAGFFVVLAHEAAHAFLDVAVFPQHAQTMPRWLNEGIAQLFENVIVDDGQAYWGRLDADRLRAAQQLLRRKEWPGLSAVLLDDPSRFKVGHLTQTLQADRHYLAAWALTHWLLVHRATPIAAIKRYVVVASQETDKLAPFSTLTEMPIAAAEAAWLDWLERVRPDGTLRQAR